MTDKQAAVLRLALKEGGYFTFWQCGVITPRVIENCVKRGWIERVNFGDMRPIQHHITDAGRAALASLEVATP